MQAGGYQTALIGKWHLKRQPAGFDHFNVFHDQGEYVNPIFKTADVYKRQISDGCLLHQTEKYHIELFIPE